MQVILDSSFARPGSAPIWGVKKGEFRDWTIPNHTFKVVIIVYCNLKDFRGVQIIETEEFLGN